ncbi:carbohydrate ABC transporter permease [Anaerosacchariphilus polymeriproducens]|uniref:Carbohydrate ABC transporter permease n=1 Tax=Anaerosacchariphilus polymeriproducens TaxID=1812858 RepID=A0A371AZK5_9FIRM|nr:carbohydrate ABC transporter permease [Anaerosacchariphilus polymeriproducens]RDU25025.1 carbohydrate ABC transporter permease [Anaerosacchariphilus polymeriproducens]
MRKKVNSFLLRIILLILGLIVVYPFIWMLSSSFKNNSEINALKQTLLPKVFTLNNYLNMNEHFDFVRFFINSILVAVTVTIIVAYTSTICGYVLCKYKFKGRKLLFGFILATMMIPWCVIIIPKYSMMKVFGWMDSYKAIIIPAMFSGFGIFMMKQNSENIPDEIIEAAKIDGANALQIFHRIIFPMSRNGIASISIFQFLWTWDDFLWPYLVIQSKDKQLLSVGLRMFNGQYATDYGALFAATAISIIPVLVIYMIFQKQFIAGIAASAVKG